MFSPKMKKEKPPFSLPLQPLQPPLTASFSRLYLSSRRVPGSSRFHSFLFEFDVEPIAPVRTRRQGEGRDA